MDVVVVVVVVVVVDEVVVVVVVVLVVVGGGVGTSSGSLQHNPTESPMISATATNTPNIIPNLFLFILSFKHVYCMIKRKSHYIQF